MLDYQVEKFKKNFWVPVTKGKKGGFCNKFSGFGTFQGAVVVNKCTNDLCDLCILFVHIKGLKKSGLRFGGGF